LPFYLVSEMISPLKSLSLRKVLRMKKVVFIALIFLSCSLLKAQDYQNLDTIAAPATLENIYSRPVYSDSLTSSFVIFIKKEVKEHKHAEHSEHIVVLDGTAVMKVDGKSFKIKKGDVLFIPKNTWHYVKTTSKIPLKVLSVQSPNFDGKDRIFK
jgi:mannose-6-phosphate isomerase-like protein (cupin superfamily)